jgi:hypothetical protein
MSLLLTDKNIFLLWRKVSNADTQDVSLSIQQRLSSFYGIKLMLIQRFLQGCSRLRHNRYLQTYILRRLIANMPAALYRYALVLLSTEQCAAMIHLNRSIIRGHLPSRATKAWILINGKEGVSKNLNEAYYLVEEGARLGCHYCQEVIDLCNMYWNRWS